LQPSTAIAFAGLAGLLAGAFSMAAGEYISMRSQREAYEREIALETMELRDDPEAEAEELALIYRAKGLDPAEAERAAAAIMKDSSVALDTMAREELGLDPDALGSPWSAAFSSLFAFALGAIVVVLPYPFRLRPVRADRRDRVGGWGAVRRGRGNRGAQRPRCPAVGGHANS
jgi:VIT1/CCC1 family predicted Fe2+/Mn2+ transporter